MGERAGFSRGLASRKYGSKDGLIEAVIWRVSAHVHEQADAAIAGIACPLEQVLALADRFVELVQRDISVRAYFVLFSAMIANRLETRPVFDEVQIRFGERLEALIVAAQADGTGALGQTRGMDALLVLAGVVTAVPLLMFAAAARRLRYATMGLLQYIAPTLQFLEAVLIFHEPLRTVHIVTFALIWTGCAIYAAGARRTA